MITDPDVHFKLVFADRKLGAAAALVDPDLVEAAPPHVIAATGADAPRSASSAATCAQPWRPGSPPLSSS